MGNDSWRERRNVYPADRKLRSRGFKILSRPRRGPVLWQRAGKTFTQAEAELFIDKAEKIG